MYGKELILDLHHCDKDTFTRENIQSFFDTLCAAIDMEQCDMHFWDYHDEPDIDYDSLPAHLKGISAIQFITTSNVTIHTLDDLEKVFLNIFSCKSFSSTVVKETARHFFGGEIHNAIAVTRI